MLQVECCVMVPRDVVEQFVFSERANETVLNNNVELTMWDRLSQIIQLPTLRQAAFPSAGSIFAAFCNGSNFHLLVTSGMRWSMQPERKIRKGISTGRIDPKIR